jgi:hypothetical protein
MTFEPRLTAGFDRTDEALGRRVGNLMQGLFLS